MKWLHWIPLRLVIPSNCQVSTWQLKTFDPIFCLQALHLQKVEKQQRRVTMTVEATVVEQRWLPLLYHIAKTDGRRFAFFRVNIYRICSAKDCVSHRYNLFSCRSLKCDDFFLMHRWRWRAVASDRGGPRQVIHSTMVWVIVAAITAVITQRKKYRWMSWVHAHAAPWWTWTAVPAPLTAGCLKHWRDTVDRRGECFLDNF